MPVAKPLESSAAELADLQAAIQLAIDKGLISPDAANVGARELVHPAFRKKGEKKWFDKKQRRTIVRTLKLVNTNNFVMDAEGNAVLKGGQPQPLPQLVQVPIEPGHNNGGSLRDSTNPLRFYLNKPGFVFPHEFDPEKYNFIFCAVSGCWEPALVSTDPNGSERCENCERLFRSGFLRYATSAKDYDGD